MSPQASKQQKSNPKPAANATNVEFSLDVVAALYMVAKEGSGLKGLYETLSAVDGTRTASSFEHQFRPIIKRANELAKEKAEGKVFEGVKPPNKRRFSRRLFVAWLTGLTGKRAEDAMADDVEESPRPDKKRKRVTKVAVPKQEFDEDEPI
ncbi:hypothetical protein M501DRAFT_939413 [Patellaria atrata CBS 101060]|uniref:Uncharacterized protein n=1 Tax=Patellaria atrata CBS 101060 TaxID=1346257 RepID=A0A9P4S569_9PEZI|nr:hypothetical protein M501DRAFT_939413 [Patellaria atrata CBS 101060]